MNYYFFLNMANKSAQLFFFITNHINENTPALATTVEPIAIPTIAPTGKPLLEPFSAPLTGIVNIISTGL